MFVNVFERLSISVGESFKKCVRIEGVEGDTGVARTCCTFFAPASWVRTLGHLIAFERSICRRAFQESGET